MYNIEEFVSGSANVESLRRMIASPGREGSLLSAKIKLTPKCNLRCRMCGIWRYGKAAEMSTARIKELLAEFASMDVVKIHFSGGEPLTRGDLIEILETCSKLKIKANITTNGTMVTKAVAKELVRAGTRGISISIDGPDRDTHDGIRGVPGAFKAATRAIELIANARESMPGSKRTRIRINTVLQRANWRRLPEIVELGGNLGADEVHPMPVDTKHKGGRLLKSEIRDFNSLVAPEAKAIRERYGFTIDPLYLYPYGISKVDIERSRAGEYALGYYEDKQCFAPWLHMFASWDGRVYPCCMMRGRVPSLGNISRTSVEKVFSGAKYAALRKTMVKKRFDHCAKCDNFLYENRMLNDCAR